MGYPMTLRRVLNRNGLRDGDYGKAPDQWAASPPVTIEKDERVISLIRHWAEYVEHVQHQVRMLAGDLRRLENDTLDERAINAHIQRQTGLDEDTVAAVLKVYLEF